MLEACFQMKRELTFVTTGFVLSAVLCAQPKRDVYLQNNLVSDLRGQGARLDPKLVNPWGISFSPTGPFWISDNHTGVVTVYNGKGEPAPAANPLVVTVPPPANGTPPSAPTGQVFNMTADFTLAPSRPALFIFDTEDGTISGWNPAVEPTRAVIKVDNSGIGAIYKGLAMGSNINGNFLFAANFHSGKIDVFDKNFASVNSPGGFVDAGIPAGFAPFNIENIGGRLYVTYAKQDSNQEDDVAGPGNGFIDVFDTSGNLQRRFASQGTLNSPWGMVVSPPDFGEFSNALLVGNFGDGRINAFNISTGAFLGQMREPSSRPLVIRGLWGLTFGNGSNGGDRNKLYFTAGIPGGGELEDHGLFGEIRAQLP
jgi:uncharacterized protein (TIGR03118 family)